MKISCIVLAGGKSLRLGRDKVFEKIGNKSLLQQVITRIEPLCNEIIIVTAEARTLPQVASHSKLRIVSDILPGRGALGGVYTGLMTSESRYNLVVACDMPFLNQHLLSYMIEAADGFDAALPRVNGRREPLHAVYARECLGPIESLLEGGRKAIIELFDFIRVRYIEAEELERFDPEHLSFFNINTEADLAQARQIVREDNTR